MNKDTTAINLKGRSQLCPALAAIIALFCVSAPLLADSPKLKLEKKQELLVPPYAQRGLAGCTPTQTGYVLRIPYRLCFFSRDLTLTHTVELKDTTRRGCRSLIVVDDTLIYVLESGGHVSQYNLEGDLLRRWRHSRHIEGKNIAVLGERIMISGERLYGSWDARPAFILYDTIGNLVTYEGFYPDSVLDFLNKEKTATIHISAQAAAFSKGFVLTTSIGPEVFIFSPTGQLQGVITDTPPGYKALSQAPRFDIQKAVQDTAYANNWRSSWDFVVGYFGIRVLDDSLLIVPRRNTGDPYYIDAYNLNQRSFVDRLESEVPVAGASSSLLFFADTFTQTFTRLSAYRIVPATATEKAPDSVLKKKDCPGCGRPLARYEYVESAEGINIVDTIPAGHGRLARVFTSHAFEPDSLVRFCHSEKKNMFVFYCLTHFAGELLIDTLYAHLKDKDEWMLITVLCYPEPRELSLYFLDLPGDQILINRNVRIPDSTIALSDLGLPPMALALTEGGKQVISGYSLAPHYDGQKSQKGVGITFEEFLKECGIIEQ